MLSVLEGNVNEALTVGKGYTRRQIHEVCGGGVQDYLPHKNGQVACACLSLGYNPNAPHEVLAGYGPGIERWARVFAVQKTYVPVFIKKGVNFWEYVGDYRVANYEGPGKTEMNSPKPAEIVAAEKGAGRPVSMILYLEAKP
jgi:hypothetical protein